MSSKKDIVKFLNFLAEKLEKANSKGSFTLSESSAIVQVLVDLNKIVEQIKDVKDESSKVVSSS